MTKSTPPSALATRFARSLALLVVCFSIWPAASSAQLTQQDIYEAIYNGVMDGMGDLSAEGALVTIPMDAQVNMDISSYLEGTANYGGFNLRNVDVGYSAALLACYVKWLVEHPATNFPSLHPTEQSLASIYQVLQYYFPNIDNRLLLVNTKLDGINYDGTDLKVYDSRVVDAIGSLLSALGDLQGSVDGGPQVIYDGLRDGFAGLGEMLDTLQTSVNQLLITLQAQSNYWDDPPPVSYPEIDSEINSEYSSAESDFDDIELPEISEAPSPGPSGQVLDESAIDLGHVDVSGDHSALIRLVDSPSRSSNSVIPSIEIDLGRDSALDLGMRNFATWIEWLAGALFGLLLSVKGLGMWRVVRTASVAAQCGTEPMIHLAFNPF